MPSRTKAAATNHVGIAKSPTGIKGLDEISGGGLPTGRTTIVCGGPGCGKTMLGVEFLVRGALEFNEPGVVMAFEETPAEIAKNVASLGFDLEKLVSEKKLFLDHVRVEPSEIEETGDYDLEGLFIRLSSAVQMVGAKRVLFDTLEALFSGFQNQGLLRAEIRRLFRWLKDQGLTAMVTAEKGEGTLTRHGLEEYVSDCVILLDHRIDEQISTRRLRIVKYRGTRHAADEFPFLIDNEGMSVLPATSMELRHNASSERVSSGVPDLDQLLEGKGYFRGSSVLVSGTAGSGKTTLAASFAVETCRRGETCLFVGFEESRHQVLRNAASVGIDLEPCAQKGLLHHEAWRPTQFGLEMHLLRIHKLVEQLNPFSVIIDPVTNLITSSSSREVNSMLMRLMDFLKGRNVTCLFTSLTQRVENQEQTDVGISSLIDTWIALRDVELNGERNRCIYVIKSRGMAHSNQVREFLMSRDGIRLVPAYVGASGVLTGSARLAQEAEERAALLLREQQIRARQSELQRRKQALEAQIAALQADFQAEQETINLEIAQSRASEDLLVSDRATMARSRQSTQGENAKTQKAGGSLR